jgi:hypothetical protein
MEEMTTQMGFLNDWTIDLNTLPKYPEFEKDFKEPLNKALIKHMARPDYDWDLGYKKYTPESRNIFVNNISNRIKGDTLIVAHRHPFNLGRYYPAESASICSQPTYMKHTCMQHSGWKDIDMKKGHPTLLCEIGRRNNFEFPAVKRYATNANVIFDEMEVFYGKGVLQEGQKKWFFNLIIYGGGPKTWFDGLESGDGGYKAIKIKRELTPLMKEYQGECKMFGDIIFKHNPGIFNLVKNVKKKDWENRNRVVSYFLQTIENHILYNAYGLLVEEGIMEKQVGALEFDGLCFPPKKEFDEAEIVDLLNTQTLIKTGIGIKWAFKPYEEVDQGLLNQEWDVFEEVSNGGVVVGDTDAGCEKQTSFMIDECVKDEQKMLWCDFNVKVPKRTCFTDVAFGDIFKLLYGDKFRFTNGFIYHFNGVYWERDNKQKSNINCFIDNVFYQDLKKWILGKILYWTKKAGETEDDDKNNKGIAFWTRVNLSVKDYIKTQRTKAEMIKAIESKVCNDSQEWDLNPYIFVFNNCVFDLKLGKKVEPNPQDFMTTCCGWDYDDNYNDVGIDKFIETIQH